MACVPGSALRGGEVLEFVPGGGGEGVEVGAGVLVGHGHDVELPGEDSAPTPRVVVPPTDGSAPCG